MKIVYVLMITNMEPFRDRLNGCWSSKPIRSENQLVGLHLGYW